MSAEWPVVVLNDVLSTIIDYRGKTPPKSETGIAVLTAASVKDGRVLKDKVSYISQETYEKVTTRGFPQEGDVLITTEAPVGEVAPFPTDKTYHITRRIMALRGNGDIIDSAFLLYALLGPHNQSQLEACTRGSTVPRVLKTDITGLEFPLPPLPVQQQIGVFLAAIDAKIGLNSRTNQTLEAMAQAIFKSWFVDFNPVKAKMRGEQPEGIDVETASLFPEKLVESELGLIPEGWGVGELSKLFELHRGFDLPKSKRQDGEYPVYAAGGYHGTHNEFKMEPPGIITGRSGVIGNVYLSLDKYWPLNTTLYVREFRTCGPYYAYHLLRSLDLKSLNSGSAVPSLNRNFVHSTNVCHPDSDVLAKFEEIVTPLFEKMVANNEQNKSLSELRDTLLPKLLSGEIELGQAQELAEVE
ncbi:restriction endonuclease subunit S [Vibrio sp. CAU 1672]|uniref:restriction endonuclease subunit S n=1 Tax=Vibrio sp. CAU 1672 TaxID=3032594 RepID=UPI0023DB2F87|nr:restriction endonuclease subunit S [Vibrio sp. CAU 1672]MDF2153559.1 restriction endonuclease subunit S [Vibrio sp. CAU 1672]